MCWHELQISFLDLIGGFAFLCETAEVQLWFFATAPVWQIICLCNAWATLVFPDCTLLWLFMQSAVPQSSVPRLVLVPSWVALLCLLVVPGTAWLTCSFLLPFNSHSLLPFLASCILNCFLCLYSFFNCFLCLLTKKMLFPLNSWNFSFSSL